LRTVAFGLTDFIYDLSHNMGRSLFNRGNEKDVKTHFFESLVQNVCNYRNKICEKCNN